MQGSYSVCLLPSTPVCLCGFVYVCLEDFIFVCILCLQLFFFTDFNDWNSVCVTWDLMLTDGVKGRMLTFAFYPGCRWTANQLFIFAAIVELALNVFAIGPDSTGSLI